MSYNVINPLSDERWTEFIAADEQANVHHHPAWLKVLSSHSNLHPQAFCSIIDGKITQGFLFFTKKNISGDTIAVSASCSSTDLFLGNKDGTDDAIRSFLKYIEQTHIFQAEFRDPVSSSAVQQIPVGYAHNAVIETCIESISGQTTAAVSRNIRKSIREGLTYEISDDTDAILDFYRLHVLTRKKLGHPVEPFDFFTCFYNEIIKTGMGYIVSVKKDGLTLSSGLFAGFNKTLTYKFGASNPDYLNHRPNNLMLWGALLEAQKRNFKIFDMGRTDKDNEGLRRFKLSWGCRETLLHYSYYPFIPQNHLLQNANRRILEPLIKNSPPAVSRLTGKLVYKLFPLKFV
jgi:hypothetical protein